VGDIFNEGLYDSHIDLSEIPILGWHAPKLSRNITAQQVMRKDVIALSPRESVGRVVDLLHGTKHHGFPVVDRIGPPADNTNYPNYGHLTGLMLRSQLVVLLRKRHFTEDYEGRRAAPGQQPVALADFRENYPRYNDVPIAELGLCRDDEQCWLDLRPFLHPSPHRVPLGASLDSIFRLFRGLGLRYLFAVDNENKLRGIITRKDIARFKERRMKNQYIVHEVYINHYGN
jgi:chloride channel 7